MARGLISWLAGAVLFVFIWWVGGMILGSEVASIVFGPTAVVLVARQHLQRRARRVTFRAAD